MHPIVAATILRTVRDACRVAITVYRAQDDEGCEIVRIVAVGECCRRWIVQHEDEYQAAVLLAETIGFQLEDG
ncbi:MAG: hypothetical protein JSR77_15110 [Planctomycetes bacterium]|nr:hypothetical protein [Planctomycetota bacterium]